MNKGQDERLEIVAYNPVRRLLVRAITLVLMIALAVGGYHLGQWSIWHERGTAVIERDELRIKTRQQEKELSELRRRVLVTESSNAVDRRAYQEVQQTVLNLNARIAQLENELHFYQRVMAPEKADRGLRIDRFDLRPTDNPRVFDYQLVITQVTDNNTFIEGRALVSLVGSRGQTMNVTLPLKDVSPEVDELSVRFRFRFFQNVAGQIHLPEDFKPEKVQVILQSTGSKAMRIESEFDWVSQEAI
ncbi:DUF6776 family protein [Marinospirillum alkaliphilum]|uniref:Uncharacterized protein n=1 Tax=Marinospirillum alkaliphilum DSM 21637 TaxID=1122209 RepID=A0A1K1WID2_9GAMM|nr:DUF6776 family protein [Marinospirillum alkaliphilum]SFX36732.1 hypothetical protein SAMN02745752_01378 [Marinospirillum alkaliphilum DSM 21637]